MILPHVASSTWPLPGFGTGGCFWEMEQDLLSSKFVLNCVTAMDCPMEFYGIPLTNG